MVTCSSRRSDLFFVRDASASIYVYQANALPPQGTWVEVRGVTGSGLFSPIISASEITALGSTNLPTAPDVAISDLAYGRYDAQWIAIEGVVTRQFVHGGHLVLQLTSGNAQVPVRVLEFDPAQVVDWIDARIRVEGVAGGAYNADRKLTGFHLYAQNTNAIRVLQPPPSDPYSAPLHSSTSLVSYAPDGASEHRSRVQGIVTIVWPGHGFVLQDAHGNIRVLPSSNSLPQIGDRVEAVGFMTPPGQRPVLRDALFRVVGKGDLPEPRAIRAGDVATGQYDGSLITLEGYILKTDEKHPDHSALVLESNQRVFRARYQDPWPIPRSSSLVGSKVRVRGVCTQDSPSSGMSYGFSIWLPTEKDLEVLEQSTAWRQRVVLIVLGSLGGLVALGGSWICLLRRRVRAQTEEVRQREAALEERYLDLFENANDIIYTHDLQGVLTSVNHSGLELLDRTAKELLGTNVESIVLPEDVPLVRMHIAEKLKGSPRTTYEVRIRRGDGQILILDVNSRLLYRDGIPIGVQGIARDITDRKEAEEALRSSERQLRASLEERERLSRDLHDDLIQSIYALGLTLDDCTRLLKTDPEDASKRLRTVTGELNRLIRDVRSFIERLETDPLSGAEFKTALQSLALTLGGRTPPHVEVLVNDEAAARLHPHHANHLLHIAREALSNSLRHGHAQRITFTLQPSRGGLRFEIADNGSGLTPESRTERRGHGLRNMNARADRLGAWLTFHSRPGEGTKIILELPQDSYDNHRDPHPAPLHTPTPGNAAHQENPGSDRG